MKNLKPRHIHRTRHNLVVPPNFTGNSHCLPQRVQPNDLRYNNVRYSAILSCCNVHSTSRPTRHVHSAAKLQDVFIKNFPRASHQPAALCAFRSLLLVLINAFVIPSFIIYMNPSVLSTTNSYFQSSPPLIYSSNHLIQKYLDVIKVDHIYSLSDLS